MHIHTYIRVCMNVCMYVRTYIRTYVRMSVCMYACMHACMHVCMYVWIVCINCMYKLYVCMYIHRGLIWTPWVWTPWGVYAGFGGLSHLKVMCQVWVNLQRHKQSGLKAIIFWASGACLGHLPWFFLAIFFHLKDLGSFFLFLWRSWLVRFGW